MQLRLAWCSLKVLPCFLSSDSLETSGRSSESTPLHLGRNFSSLAISFGEGTFVLSISKLHRYFKDFLQGFVVGYKFRFLFTECADRELLPAFHEVSVYPKKELPFFILFTAGLCSFTALLALLTHQYPESMGVS